MTDLLIRALTPADAPAVAFLFARMSPESRHRRFHAVKRHLEPAELRRLTDVDHWHHEALIAWSPQPRAPIGVARYVRGADFDIAEIAVAVADAWQRRGIGTMLAVALRERALAAGIRRYTASVLAHNRPALVLARRLGTATTTTRHHDIVEVTGSWAA